MNPDLGGKEQIKILWTREEEWDFEDRFIKITNR